MLAHNLGLKVVAEGAETQEHIILLKQLNCEMAQGYFYSLPVDSAAMSKLLSANEVSARVASVGSQA
jgi:EAL domain-containing protein (putative c-di-GMP-specific phosphodiesterase class I)